MNNEIKEILEDIKEIYYFKPLLDYITNLQETIDFQDKWLEYYKDFISENNIKDYKSRIEKADEYIKEHTTSFGDVFIPASESWYLSDTLNAKGEDNE